MKKAFILFIVLFELFPFCAFSQQSNGIHFRLTPGAIIPIGDSADRYGIGISADFEGEYYFPFAPTLFALGNLGVEQSKNTITDKELSLLSAGGGAGIALSPFSRLVLKASACGGYYFSMYDNQTGGSAFLKSGIDISFQFTHSFSMGLSGTYHHYLTGPEVFFQGIQASLGVSFNPAGVRGRSKIEFMDIRFEQVFAVSPYTLCSVPSLLTGRSWVEHGVIHKGEVLPEDMPQFEGFDFNEELNMEGDSVQTFFLMRGIRFPSLKYNNSVEKLDLEESSLAKSIEKHKDNKELMLIFLYFLLLGIPMQENQLS